MMSKEQLSVDRLVEAANQKQERLNSMLTSLRELFKQRGEIDKAIAEQRNQLEAELAGLSESESESKVQKEEEPLRTKASGRRHVGSKTLSQVLWAAMTLKPHKIWTISELIAELPRRGYHSKAKIQGLRNRISEELTQHPNVMRVGIGKYQIA